MVALSTVPPIATSAGPSFPEPLSEFFAVPEPEQHPRPNLRVIPGGREAALRYRRSPHVYRRRQRVAAVLLALLVVCLVVGVRTAAVAVFDRTSTPGAGRLDQVDPPSETYIVQPGDTLWSIAQELRPGADPRPVVDELSELNGGASVEAGQTLDVSGIQL